MTATAPEPVVPPVAPPTGAALRILVLTFYYAPDLCAGSFRATPFVEALSAAAPLGSQVDVITTLPNRYASFSADAPAVEERPGLSVTRVALPAHRSGTIDQSKSFATYARAVRWLVAGRRYDLVFATSSRLMTAVLGAAVARRNGARLYLDIRDIFVDTIKDVFSRRAVWLAGPAFAAAERWAVERADRVNLVSAGFADYFRARYPRQCFSFLTNGVDDEFLAAAPRAAEPRPVSSGPVTALYAGNLGEGQGLHAVVPELARALAGRVRFRIIGDGGRRAELAAGVARAGVQNVVELVPPMRRDALLDAYGAADVLFLHLNDYDAFRKVLPSKLFEYAALGKPVWAGVAGYAAEFVAAEVSNAAVFPPCDVAAAVRAFDALALGTAPRPAFVAKYARANISRALAADVLAVARGAACAS